MFERFLRFTIENTVFHFVRTKVPTWKKKETINWKNTYKQWIQINELIQSTTTSARFYKVMKYYYISNFNLITELWHYIRFLQAQDLNLINENYNKPAAVTK